MAKFSITFAALCIANVYSDTLLSNGAVHRVVRSPYYYGPPAPGQFPPPPPPYPPLIFHAKNWSGLSRNADGLAQGVFSGAEATAGSSLPNSGSAYSLASSGVIGDSSAENCSGQSGSGGESIGLSDSYNGKSGQFNGHHEFDGGARSYGFKQSQGSDDSQKLSKTFKESHYAFQSNIKKSDNQLAPNGFNSGGSSVGTESNGAYSSVNSYDGGLSGHSVSYGEGQKKNSVFDSDLQQQQAQLGSHFSDSNKYRTSGSNGQGFNQFESNNQHAYSSAHSSAGGDSSRSENLGSYSSSNLLDSHGPEFAGQNSGFDTKANDNRQHYSQYSSSQASGLDHQLQQTQSGSQFRTGTSSGYQDSVRSSEGLNQQSHLSGHSILGEPSGRSQYGGSYSSSNGLYNHSEGDLSHSLIPNGVYQENADQFNTQSQTSGTQGHDLTGQQQIAIGSQFSHHGEIDKYKSGKISAEVSTFGASESAGGQSQQTYSSGHTLGGGQFSGSNNGQAVNDELRTGGNYRVTGTSSQYSNGSNAGYSGVSSLSAGSSSSSGYNSLNGSSFSSGDLQSTLGGAFNLASQGLQASQQSGCSTCGKSSYALSNARSKNGPAIALSIGG